MQSKHTAHSQAQRRAQLVAVILIVGSSCDSVIYIVVQGIYHLVQIDLNTMTQSR